MGVLYNCVLRAPLIFLRIAESQVGELDMLVTPHQVHYDPLLDLDANETADPSAKFSYFNATALQRSLSTLPTVSGATPRWLLTGKAAPRSARAGERVDTSILICDLAMEDRLQIGRGWPYRLLGEGEAHVTASLLLALGLKPRSGHRLVLDIGVGKLLDSFGLDAAFLEEVGLVAGRADDYV